ncbi:MAG: hypothetical protein HY820_41840 [Acidobacteria bacterium]|nr:hypothetical protein [Acidobacteriota bacterium]
MKLLIVAMAATLMTAGEAPAFPERIRKVIETSANIPNGSYATIAARLKLRRDADWCSRRLLELLREPSGDMFWQFPITAIALLDQGQLTTEARTALRQSWKTYMPYRGDTENHWLLYYTTLYLMAQKYPNEAGESWFTGKSSNENLREAEGFLYEWMRLTTTIGQGEYDCTQR